MGETKLTNTRKDIIKMLSFLNNENTEFSIEYTDFSAYVKIPDGILTEIRERRELDVIYLLEKHQLQFNAYDEDYHNGNSYRDYYYYVELKDYLDETVAIILKSITDKLYAYCFTQEKTSIIDKMVNDSLKIKLDSL